MKQGELFGTLQQLPAGLLYSPEFITREEELALLEEIRKLPLREAQYKEYTARRRIISYGASYDFSTNELLPAGPIPPFLHPLRARIARWAEVPAEGFTQSLIAEYEIGSPLGWHRDVPQFDVIAGVSLGGRCRMRLRRYPPKKGTPEKALVLNLDPRSAYVMRGEARWGWQHSIPPTKETRYSITFRTFCRTE